MRKFFGLLSLAICLAVSACTSSHTTSSSSNKETPTNPAGGGDQTHVITGELTLHGTTKSISFPAKVTATDDALTLTSTFTIDRAAFGMDKMTDKVMKDVEIKVTLKTNRKGDNAGAITPENNKIEFLGKASDHQHDGGFKSFTGSIKSPDGDITKSTISVDIDTDSIWTDDDKSPKPKLTGHLKSPDFFDAKKHPKASFVSKEIKAK